MATHGRINEILEEMENNPALAAALRERIMGEEFVNIPGAVAQNQNMILGLMDRQIQLAETTRTAMEGVASAVQQTGEAVATALETQGRRLDGLESAVRELRDEQQKTSAALVQTQEDVKQIQTDVQDLRTDVKQVQTDVKQVQTDVKQVQTDVKQVQTDVKQVQTDVKQVQTDVKQVQTDVQDLRTDVRRIDGRLDRGFGTNYEVKIASNIRSILGQKLHIRNSKALKGPNLRTDENFEKDVEAAENNGRITPEETDDLWLLDLIVSGNRREGGERVYVAAEVSITPGDDADRAARRAGILRKITGRAVTPVVIATRADEAYLEMAAGIGVEVAIHPE